MIYKIDDDCTYETAEEVAEHISQNNIDMNSYDEMLDDCYREFKVGNITYLTSQVFATIDPIAYDCGFDEYVDNIYGEILYFLKQMSDGDIQDFYGSSVKCIEEDKDNSDNKEE